MLRAARDQFWRICRIVSGIMLLLVGLFLSLPGIPGPGIVLIFVGFGVLSRDFEWARRWHLRLKDTAPADYQPPENGQAPKAGSNRTRGQP